MSRLIACIEKEIEKDSKNKYYSEFSTSIKIRLGVCFFILIIVVVFLTCSRIYNTTEIKMVVFLYLVILVPLILREIECYSLANGKRNNRILRIICRLYLLHFIIGQSNKSIANVLHVNNFVLYIGEYVLAGATTFWLTIIWGVPLVSGVKNNILLSGELAVFLVLVSALLCFKISAKIYLNLTLNFEIIIKQTKELSIKTSTGRLKGLKSVLISKYYRNKRKTERKQKFNQIEKEKMVASLIVQSLGVFILITVPHHDNEMAAVFVEEILGLITISALLRETSELIKQIDAL